jgi:hypothetical protein
MKKEKWFGLLLAVGILALLMVQPADSKKSEDPTVQHIKATMKEMNLQLESLGENVRIGTVEYYTASDKAGQIVHFDDRTKQMGSHWVPGDPRRGGFWDISWLSDQGEGMANGASLQDTQDAVTRAMTTWDGVKCSDIPLTQLPDFGIDWGYVQWLAGMGGIPGWLADITQAGWLPGLFFDIIGGTGGSDEILGVTFTYVWINLNTGEPTDIDNNGKEDVAFREIYYNNKFLWSINPTWPEIDIETVVLHETGHGLSQYHFGKLFQTDANGKFHFAPRAVMNAGYTGVQRELSGTDNGGHCSIWAAWPNK